MPKPTKRDLPLSVMKRIMLRSGAERVSKQAVDQLALEIERLLTKIVPLAVKNAEHGHRKTLRADDVELAFTHWRNEL